MYGVKWNSFNASPIESTWIDWKLNSYAHLFLRLCVVSGLIFVSLVDMMSSSSLVNRRKTFLRFLRSFHFSRYCSCDTRFFHIWPIFPKHLKFLVPEIECCTVLCLRNREEVRKMLQLFAFNALQAHLIKHSKHSKYNIHQIMFDQIWYVWTRH